MAAAALVASPPPAQDSAMGEADDDAAMRSALAPCLSQGGGASSSAATPAAAAPSAAPEGLSAVLQDPSFLQSVISSLPGVDPNDARSQSVLKGGGDKEGDESKAKDPEK